jgi:hypothetical protein
METVNYGVIGFMIQAPGGGGGCRAHTLDLEMMRLMFYLCADATG